MSKEPLGLIYEVCQNTKGELYVLTLAVLMPKRNGLMFDSHENAGAFLISYLNSVMEKV